MLTIAAGMDSLLGYQTHRFSFCYKITKANGDVLRVTDHDTILTLSDDQDYTPVGGFFASAQRKEAGLRNQDIEFNGVIDPTGTYITSDELRGGLFREAECFQYLVDWRYPWAGSFETKKFWISDVSFDGEKWTGEVAGLGKRLEQNVGMVASRDCRNDFGDSLCKLTKSSYTTDGTVTAVTESRRIFTASGSFGSFSDNYFNDGELTWTTGYNDNLTAIVKDYTQATITFELILPAAFDIQAGDTFSVVAGCSKIETICKTKFASNNFDNFQGYPHMPGSDRLFTTPPHK
jgi:uncharacterized phage protein (TIGR02218 family)